MLEDCRSSVGMSRSTFEDYSKTLRSLYIAEEIPAWGARLRSRSTMRGSQNKNLADPSVAAAVLGATPENLSMISGYSVFYSKPDARGIPGPIPFR